jgi:hypothetical protein
MYYRLYAVGTSHRRRVLLTRDKNRHYYGKEVKKVMDKAKVIKTGLKIGALVLAAAVTVINDKVAKNEMNETVTKKVAEALENQAKES